MNAAHVKVLKEIGSEEIGSEEIVYSEAILDHGRHPISSEHMWVRINVILICCILKRNDKVRIFPFKISMN